MPRSGGQTVRLAVDAAGGDRAPDAILAGVASSLAADDGLLVVLLGPAEVVVPFAEAHERVEPHPTTEVIGMDEHPASAIRSRSDSSIVVGARLLKEGAVDAFFSAGNTGAMTAAGTLVTGRIAGVSRPAIATVLPTSAEPVVLLDAGANADVKPAYLVQFAHMGAAYARAALGVTSPRIALLSIGEEATKGNELTVEAHALLRDVPGFVGNIEGRDIPAGVVDVVVTDGFTGNVVLKLMEGLSSAFFSELRGVVGGGLATRLAGAVLRPGLARLHDQLDPDATGGAPLLGIEGVMLIGHGSSGPRAVGNALRVGATAVRGDLVGTIRRALSSPPGQGAAIHP